MADEQLVKGCCPLDCQDSCAWIAHVAEGRVVRVTGAKEHPFTRGILCAKVRDYEARTYAPDRILHPLRRAGLKGDGSFESSSWLTELGAAGMLKLASSLTVARMLERDDFSKRFKGNQRSEERRVGKEC